MPCISRTSIQAVPLNQRCRLNMRERHFVPNRIMPHISPRPTKGAEGVERHWRRPPGNHGDISHVCPLKHPKRDQLGR
jgi:hypothetical protein